MVSIPHIYFWLQNKWFKRSQGNPLNLFTHNNHKQLASAQANVQLFNQTFNGHI